jgi:hypothetical protein
MAENSAEGDDYSTSEAVDKLDEEVHNEGVATSIYQYNKEQMDLVHFYDFYRSALLGHRYNAYKLSSVRTRINIAELAAAITSSGAIVALPLWASSPWKSVFLGMLVVSALASITRSVFGWSQELDLRSRLCSSWLDLYMEMESLANHIQSHGHVRDSDRAQIELLSERFRKLNTLDTAKSDDALMLRLQDEIDRSIPPEKLWLPV